VYFTLVYLAKVKTLPCAIFTLRHFTFFGTFNLESVKFALSLSFEILGSASFTLQNIYLAAVSIARASIAWWAGCSPVQVTGLRSVLQEELKSPFIA